MKIGKPFMRLLLPALSVLFLGACAGPKAPPNGPSYYVTDGVTKVVYGQEEGQVACERINDTGSHVKETYCYTAREVAEKHFSDARQAERFGHQRCPEPGLCKR